MVRRLFILPLLLPALVFGQMNLVPNGDFEQKTEKPFPCSWLIDDDNINDYVYNWYTTIGTSTDVMSAYSDDDCWSKTPYTGEGTREPHSGKVMIGLINYSPDGGCQPNEWHEYLSVKLTQALVPGNLYCIEFWVALGENSYYATNNIGALLTKDNPQRNSCAPIFTQPQVNVERVINNTKEWLRIDASFLADSAYEYLTIGNFFSHENTIIETQKNHPVRQPQENNTGEVQEEETIEKSDDDAISYLAYYFIDDVRLYLCPSVNNKIVLPTGN